jgi:redox-sensitive bicupin YhaK (pirin superfamily)
MQSLSFAELPQGGFGGLKERRFVTDSRVFSARKHPAAAEGLHNFVYLADANCFPHGETGLHPHREIDVISIMVEGRISHAGSLQHGQNLDAGTVQVQRAGAEGFTHNEINPDDQENQMIQLWVLPDQPGEAAGYSVYQPEDGQRTRIYGGPKEQSETFYSSTLIDVINATQGQTYTQDGDFMAYTTRGDGLIAGEPVVARTLTGGSDMTFEAKTDSQLILIYGN